MWAVRTRECYYSALKGAELSVHEKTRRKLKRTRPSERSRSVSFQLCDVLKKATLGTVTCSGVARGWRGGRDEQAEPRGQLRQENAPYDTARMDTCRYTFIQTHRMSSTKSESVRSTACSSLLPNVASGAPPWTPSPKASQLCTQPGHTGPGAPLPLIRAPVRRLQTAPAPACRLAPPQRCFPPGVGVRGREEDLRLNCTCKMVNFIMCFLSQLKQQQ